MAAGLLGRGVSAAHALPQNVDERIVRQQFVDDFEVGVPDVDSVTGDAAKGKGFLGSDADQQGFLRAYAAYND